MDYVYYDPDPGKNHHKDCVKRSLCCVTGRKYLDIQRELNHVKWDLQAEYVIPKFPWITYRDKEVRNGFASRQGWEYAAYSPDTKLTVEEFANTHPHGTYIVAVNGHWTACKDGMIYDTFDPGERIVLETWKVR